MESSIQTSSSSFLPLNDDYDEQGGGLAIEQQYSSSKKVLVGTTKARGYEERKGKKQIKIIALSESYLKMGRKSF